MSSKCANYSCTKHIKDENECFACSLCKVQYCSEECGYSAWISHACPNTRSVPTNKNENIWVPYHYEDMLPESEVEKLAPTDPVFASYSVQHRNANGTVRQRIEPSLLGAPAVGFTEKGDFLGRGAAPDMGPGGLPETYSITVSTGSKPSNITSEVTVGGATQSDMIYLRNTNNDAAAQLAGKGVRGLFRGGGFRRRVTKRSQKWVFWPAPADVDNAGLAVNTNGDYISVTLTAGSKSITVDGYYDFNMQRGAMSRSVKKVFDLQLKTKFKRSAAGKGINISTKDVQVIRARDLLGNQVALAFLLNPGSRQANLVDIEFMADQRQIRGGGGSTSSQDSNYSYYNKGGKKGRWSRSKNNIPGVGEDADHVVFTSDIFCDTKDVSRMMGLALALELTAASDRRDLSELFGGGSPQEQKGLAKMENYAQIISRHVRWMDSQNPETVAARDVPSEVNNAVVGSLELLMYDAVGRGLTSSAKWKDKLERIPDLDEREEFASTRAEELAMRIAKARGATGLKKLALKVVKSVTLRQLEALKKAINKMSEVDGREYKEALDWIKKGRSPNFTQGESSN